MNIHGAIGHASLPVFYCFLVLNVFDLNFSWSPRDVGDAWPPLLSILSGIHLIPVAVAVRPISKGEEIFVSYNYGLGENSPEWYRRQYETAVSVAPGGHYDKPSVRSCLAQ
jgi:hypothetical protein